MRPAYAGRIRLSTVDGPGPRRAGVLALAAAGMEFTLEDWSRDGSVKQMERMDFQMRLAVPDDESSLWLALAWAAHMSEDGSPGDVERAKSDPDLARYVEDWGRSGDLGFVAEDDIGRFLGAAWIRLMEGYAYIDDETPELSIGVAPGMRGEGIGTELLTRLFEVADRQHEAICLSVREDNPAKRLYLRHGFEVVEGTRFDNPRADTTSVTLIRSGRGV